MNSILNPEAPEFYPNLTTVTQNGFTTINKSIKSSHQLPSGSSYDLFKTFTEFNNISRQLSQNVIEQSNQIVITELPAVRLKWNDNESNSEKIIDSNDSMLDRVNINIDTICGVNKPGQLEVGKGANVSSWNQSPVITKIQVGTTMFVGAKNIPRSQLKFKDKIDNSENLWVPKISDKPNNIKPLALNIIYNDIGEAVGYEHPYEMELDLYTPPGEFLCEPTLELEFPPPVDVTPLTYVDTEQGVDRLVEHLSTVQELAVDVEHHSYRTYQGITCLVQISTDTGGDFIIDTLEVREHMHKLNVIFTDPKKLKVFHGADYDVLWLQRDFGVYLVGLFDTFQAAKVLQHSGLSLKHLLMHYCKQDADKRHQLADWRIRPLPAELIEYARMDTHYLLYIARKMRQELLQKPNGDALLNVVFDRSKQTASTTYNKGVIDENSHMWLYRRSRKSFNSRQMAALRMLYKWRDVNARELDESTSYLLPNHMMLALCDTLPREVQGVTACCNPTPPFLKQHLPTVHRMILSCRELPLEPQLLHMPTALTTMSAPLTAAAPQTFATSLHDLTHHQYADEANVELETTILNNDLPDLSSPDIEAFLPQPNETRLMFKLNVEAKLFIPPYDRYRKYRSLAQLEEIKEYKNKEAKITAISKGNELIKSEVLAKLQQATSRIENQATNNANLFKPTKKSNEKIDDVVLIDDEDDDVQAVDDEEVILIDDEATPKNQRKRRFQTDNVTERNVKRANETHEGKKNANRQAGGQNKGETKPFQYANANYNKFFTKKDTPHVRSTKGKFKKRK